MDIFVYDQEQNLVKLQNVSAPTLMRAIQDAGLDLTAQCGGCASCGTCHVYVDAEWQSKVEPPSDFEEDMLDLVLERRENSRLSCQVELTDDLNGLTVSLAPGSGFS